VASLNPFQFKPETKPAESVSSPEPPTSEPPKSLRAWQPFTPRGVGAFAAASSGYLYFFQFVVAVLGSACIVWFLWTGWFPVIREGILHLPTDGVIENHVLKAPIDPAEPLSSSRLLGITADPEDQGSTDITTDLLVQLKKTKVRFCSLLGCTDLNYTSVSKNSYILFNRTELEPQWDAWEPILLTIAALGSFFALLASWFVLETLYFVPVWFFARIRKKELSLGGSWRLSGAALMPGALLFSASIVCYRLGMIDLVRLFTLSILHLVVGWVYLVTSALGLPPKELEIALVNPFSTEPASGEAGAPAGSETTGLSNVETPPSGPEEAPPPNQSQKSADENPS
jgi:hypothetical protein